MRCRRLDRRARPAGWWHRLWCADCRAAWPVDDMLAYGVKQMRANMVADATINSALEVIGLPAIDRVAQRRARRVRRWKRLALGTFAFASLGYGWYGYINQMPNIVIPTPRMPSPNAFDYYKQAGLLLKDDKAIGEALTPKDPAAAPKQPAVAASGSGGIAVMGAVPRPPEDGLAEKERLLRENQDTLAVLNTGLAYSYQEPPARSFSALFPHYSKDRAVARLLALKARTEADRGDWDASMNSDLDAMQMGEEIEHGAPMIGNLVGIACQAIGRGQAWKAVEHLDAAQARAASRRLNAIQARQVSFAETLQEEKWMTQGGLLEFFHTPNWRFHLRELLPIPHSEDAPPALINLAAFVWMSRYSNRQIMDNYTRYMDASIADARLPYTLETPQLDRIGPQNVVNEALLQSMDPINRILLPVFSNARFQDVNTETQNLLLLVSLALRAYYLDHHAYPSSLYDLVYGGYLEHVPIDPFSPGSERPLNPLRYKRISPAYGPAPGRCSVPGYVLYSVGPDGTDNDGTPIDKPTNGSTRYRINGDSKGDIVAGLNQ